MALDRVVNWVEVVPTNEQIEGLLVGYFDGLGKVAFTEDRWVAGLPDRNTKHALYRDERWIEIWPSRKSVFVMTREQDEITNAVAAGLARLLARTFRGKLEEE